MPAKPIKMPVYMDYNATTPVDPRVREAMLPFLHEAFGNPASGSHEYGWQAQEAVKKARAQLAALIGCREGDVVWTSGATESNNMAILGVIRSFCREKPHIVTQATEHKSVLEVCEAAIEWGTETTVLPVDPEGRVRLEDLTRALRPNTVLVSIMAANNEVGTLQPVADIGTLCRDRGVIFHIDAAQAVGKIPVDLKVLKADLVSISGHKMYGPKGIGALVVRPVNREFQLKPLMFGGEQEKKLRPGTLNVAGIVGLGAAAAVAERTLETDGIRISGFQRRLFDLIRGRFPQVKINGPLDGRLANNLSFSFPNFHADDMALDLSGIAYSSGSACNSSSPKPSHVLKAMGVGDQMARATLRLGLGRFTTAEEVEVVADKLLKMLSKVYIRGL